MMRVEAWVMLSALAAATIAYITVLGGRW